MVKKKYNPFKMWGSYVGAVVLPIFDMLLNGNNYGKIANIFEFIPEFIFRPFRDLIGEVAYVFGLGLALAILGFLTGYGIHALIRRLRK